MLRPGREKHGWLEYHRSSNRAGNIEDMEEEEKKDFVRFLMIASIVFFSWYLSGFRKISKRGARSSILASLFLKIFSPDVEFVELVEFTMRYSYS